MRQLEIDKNNENGRLDKFLLKYMNAAPKSFVYKMLRKKNIKLNGKRAEGSEILKNGDVVTLFISDDTLTEFMSKRQVRHSNINVDVVYEDSNVLLCNKPVGVLSQNDGSENDSINDAMLYYLYKKGEYDASAESTFKPGICNRLDRNTGGITAMGKNLAAAQALNAAYKNKCVEKLYITVVKGYVKDIGIIKGWHSKDSNNKAVIYDEKRENTAYVETAYRPVAVKNGYTLLEVTLISGKSHQIRVSLEHLGFPVAGDKKYGGRWDNPFGASHQILYAYKLIFKEETGFLAYLAGKEFKINYDNTLKRVFDWFERD